MYYFLQIQALRRWTLMYVIRFSKSTTAQVSSVTFKDSIQFSLCQESRDKTSALKTEPIQRSHINPS